MKLLIFLLFINSAIASTDIHKFVSKHDFLKTNEAVEKFIKKKGLNLFTTVDHSANAQRVNLNLAPSKLYIFGNPKVGTPLMQLSPSIGLDLPVKVLVYEGQDKKILVSYNDPSALAKKHQINPEHESFKKMGKVLSGLEKTLKK